MAGGLFGGAQGSNPAANSDSNFRGDSEDYVTHELSPGGLFNQEGRVAEGAGGVPAAASADIAEEYAEDAGQWAVGPTDFQADTLKGYSDTNNSKYYSEQADADAAQASADAAAASMSAADAANSAAAADTSANQAFASAAAADASAMAAATSATQAANSATAAENSATESAASATASADSAAESAASAVEADSDARAAELALADARAAALEADSDRCFVEALVSGTGDCADIWVSTQPGDGQAEIATKPNGTRVLFDLPIAIPNVEVRNTQVFVDFVELTLGPESGNIPAGQFDIDHLLGSTSVTFGQAPATGQRIDVFVFDSDKISAARSMEYIRDNIQFLDARIASTVEIVDSDAEAARDWQEWSRHWARGDSAARSGFWVGKLLDSDAINNVNIVFNSGRDARIFFDSDEFGNSDRVPFTLLGLSWEVYRNFDTVEGATILLPPANNQTFVTARLPVGQTWAAGDRVDIFEDEPSDSDAAFSAFYQAERAAYFARLFSDSEIEIRAGFGLTGGRTYNHNHPEDVLINLAIDSDVTATRQFVIDLIDQQEDVKIAYGLDSERVGDDKFIEVDSDVIASRRYVDERLNALDAVRAGYGLDSEQDGIVKTLLVDSDVFATRQFVLASGTNVAAGQGIDVNTTTDSAGIRTATVSIDSDYIQSLIDSDSDSGTFISHPDTPLTYAGAVGEFPRVNTDSDALEFFDPFPVNVSTNRLSVLNGLTIRSFGSNYIEFASFTPSISVDSRTLNWDAPADASFIVRGTNSADFQSQFLSELTQFTIGGNAFDVSGVPVYNSYAENRTWTIDSDYIDNTAWNGGAVTATILADVDSTHPTIHLRATNTLTWRAAGWNITSDVGNNQNFDLVHTAYSVTLTPANTTSLNNITNAVVSNRTTLANLSQFGSVYFHNFPGVTLYHDDTVHFGSSATFTKPATVSKATDRTHVFVDSDSFTPNTVNKVWYIVAANQAAAVTALGTLSNAGYSTAQLRTGTNMGNSRAQYGNGQTGVSLFVIGTGTINSIQETTNSSFPINQDIPTPTTVALGHTGHTVNYRFYQIPLADNAGNFYTIT